IAYELVQGALVRWSTVGSSARPPPTCVFVHGILGSRRNMLSFAQRLTREFSSWQVLLVDLRCHGESARHGAASHRPNGVESAAADVLDLLRHLKLFPEVLIGHSFGGKVVMSMADQFGRIGPRLPRPVQVWVLDALPGAVREHHASDLRLRQDHPADLIPSLQAFPVPTGSRTTLQTYLVQSGFSQRVASWVTSNLKPTQEDPRKLSWTIDMKGIAEMYESYESLSYWPFLSAPTQGIKVDFVRAENSSYVWPMDDVERLKAYGHRVHHLPQAGHWLHADNPDGLLEILAPTFTYARASTNK
ncbi:alpha/beta-hydrolase, partial [Coccomyxa subellipsoidea C-169]